MKDQLGDSSFSCGYLCEGVRCAASHFRDVRQKGEWTQNPKPAARWAIKSLYVIVQVEAQGLKEQDDEGVGRGWGRGPGEGRSGGENWVGPALWTLQPHRHPSLRSGQTCPSPSSQSPSITHLPDFTPEISLRSLWSTSLCYHLLHPSPPRHSRQGCLDNFPSAFPHLLQPLQICSSNQAFSLHWKYNIFLASFSLSLSLSLTHTQSHSAHICWVPNVLQAQL